MTKIIQNSSCFHKHPPLSLSFSLSSDILHISSLLPPLPPCTLFEVNPVLFVPHAARSCCRLFYKSIARLTSLVFYQFLCRMSLCRVPALQRRDQIQYSWSKGGVGHLRDTTGVIFTDRYQTLHTLFSFITLICHVYSCILTGYRDKWTKSGREMSSEQSNMYNIYYI